MLIFWAVLGGFLLDAVFGDPVWLLHPVVLMGRCITALEKRLRAALPKTPQGELAGGCIVAAVLPLLAAKMAPGGVVLCETEREADLPEQAGSLTLVKQYNYGKIKVSRYERGEEA